MASYMPCRAITALAGDNVTHQAASEEMLVGTYENIRLGILGR